MAQNGNSNNLQPPQVQDRFPEGRYSCKFCPKKFSNSQALGGHQNAHKLERAILSQQGQMLRRDMNIPSHGGYPVGTQHYYPYPMPGPSMVAPPPVCYYSVPPPHHHYFPVAQGPPGYHGIISRGMMMGQQFPPAAAYPGFMPGSRSSTRHPVPNRPTGQGFYPNPIPFQGEGSGDGEETGESEVDLTLRL